MRGSGMGWHRLRVPDSDDNWLCPPPLCFLVLAHEVFLGGRAGAPTNSSACVSSEAV